MIRFSFGLHIILIAVLIICVRCSITDLSGGGTIETTNGLVIGKLILPDGSPAGRTNVMLLPSGFDPVKGTTTIPCDTTDEDGNYTFSSVYPGDYKIQAVQLESRTRAIINGISVAKDTITVAADTLRTTGLIKLSFPNGSNSIAGYAYIPGTTFFVFLSNHTDFVVLDSIPAGVIPVLLYSSKDSTLSTPIRVNVPINSGETTFIWNPSWNYARKLVLNTSTSGANVRENVVDFPVLVKLNSGNFDFSQAQPNGADIRFTKADDTPLSHEIERWDAVQKHAELWVMVDSVHGDDSSQSITMYWGNSNAIDDSNGAAVFDTANGFNAVWHLNTDCSDVTSGKHGGTNFGATDTVGIIGGAKKFDGSSYIEVPGLLDAPQSITLSAWVHLDSAVGYGQEIISLGDAVAIRADQNAPDGTAGFFCSKVSGSDTVHVFTNTGAVILKTGWRYLAYTVDAARNVQSMYIDGIFQCSTNDTNPIDYSGLGSNTFLGTHGNKKTLSNVFGYIDEAAVCRVARSADWIKLCYMNQKQQDALVVFK